MPNWYVLVCRSRSELTVREKLEALGFDAMVPVQHRVVRASRHAKRREIRSSVLLLGYIFVCVEGPLPWWQLREVPHVIGFLAQEGEPYALRPADVARLIALSELKPVEDPYRPLRPGDSATITTGPFAGRTVKVSDIVGNDAEWVGKMFGAMRTVKTPLSSLQAALAP
jgi:transcription antitermination factor NusG